MIYIHLGGVRLLWLIRRRIICAVIAGVEKKNSKVYSFTKKNDQKNNNNNNNFTQKKRPTHTTAFFSFEVVTEATAPVKQIHTIQYSCKAVCWSAFMCRNINENNNNNHNNERRKKKQTRHTSTEYRATS